MNKNATRRFLKSMSTKSVLICVALFLALLAPKAGATVVNQYYDDAGTGAPGGGSWDLTSSYWTSSTTLTVSTVQFTNGNSATFCAGSGVTAAQTVTVNSPGITCANITNLTFTNGITFSGTGSITLSPGTNNIVCGPDSPGITIDVPLMGSGGIVQHGNGYLALYATNTFSGGTLMTGGQVIYYNNYGSFGTGPITNSSTPGSGIVNNSIPEIEVNISNNFYWASGNYNSMNLAGGFAVGGQPGTIFWGNFYLTPNGNTIIYTSNTNELVQIAGSISGSGSGINLSDNGTLWLSGTNSYTGNTYISNLTALSIIGGGCLGVTATATNYSGNITNSSTNAYGLYYDSTAAQTLSGVISGAGALVVSNTGSLTLTGNNTYTGATTINGGTVNASGANALPSGTHVTVSNGVLNATASGALASSSVIFNSGALNVTAAGAVTSASLTFNAGSLDVQAAGSITSSSITMTNGFMELDNPAAFSNPEVALTLPSSPTNGTVFLNYPSTATPAYVVVLNFGSNSIAPGTWGGPGSGAANISDIFTGTGQILVGTSTSYLAYWDPGMTHTGMGSGGNGSWDNSTSDWFVGSSDSLWVNGDAAEFAGAAGTVTVNSNIVPGALYFETASYVLTNGPGYSIGLSNTTTPITVPAGTTTIASPITGEGLSVTGPGTLALNGANTYTAGTSIGSGTTVSVNSVANGFGTGTVTVSNSTINYTGIGDAMAQVITGPPGTSNFFNVPNGVTVTLNNAVTVASPGGASWYFNKTGGGTLVYAGGQNNAYTGMNVMAGTVILQKTAGSAIGSPFYIQNGAEIQLNGVGTGNINIYSGTTTPGTIFNGGVLDLKGNSASTYNLYLYPGGQIINSVSGTTVTLTCPSGSDTLLGNYTLGGANSLGGLTVVANITGNGSLTYATGNANPANAILTLTGTNTFDGGLIVPGGYTILLNCPTGAGAGTGPITLNANSILNVQIGVSNDAIANPIVGPASSTVNMLSLPNIASQLNSDMSAFTGTLNIYPTNAGGSAAMVEIGAPTFTINPGATINVSNGATLYLEAVGTVIPCPVNFYGLGNAGPYGALRLDNGSEISGNVTFGGTTNTTMANDTTIPSTISGNISGPNGFTTTANTGTIVLAGASTFTGTNIFGGCEVQLASPENGTSGPLGEPSPLANTLVFNAGALKFTAANTYDYSGRFASTSTHYNFDLNGQTVTFASPIAGGATTTFSTYSTYVSSNYGGTINLSAANTYGGTSSFSNSVIVQLNVADTPGTSGALGSSIAASSILLTSGATLRYTAANNQDYSSRLSSSSTGYCFDLNGQTVTFASALGGSASNYIYSATNTGTLILDGSNTFTGTTYIDPGATLEISGKGSLGFVAAGPNKYAGTVYDFGALVFNTASNNLLTGAIAGTGSLTQSGTGTLVLSGAETYAGGTLVSAGTLVISNSASVQGDVTVTGGTLVCSNASGLISAATLTLPSSSSLGTVALNYSGMMTIGALYFGSAPQPGGTYGAIGSGATYTSAYFTGTGILNVASASAYWDPGNPTQRDAAPGSGGNGNWDNTVTADWYNGTGDVDWSTISGAIPNFAGAAGIVTLNDNVAADGLIFTTSGYTLNGPDTLTLSGALGNSTPIIMIPSGTTTISSAIASGTASNTVYITGPGTLALTGNNNALTNPLTIAGATVSFNSLADSGTSALGDIGIFGNNSTNIINLVNAGLYFTGTSGRTSRNLELSGTVPNVINVPSGSTLEFDSRVYQNGTAENQSLIFQGGGTLILGGTGQDNGSLDMNILAGTVILNKINSGSGHGLGGGQNTIASGAELQLSGTGNAELYSQCWLFVSNNAVFDLNGQSDAMGALYITGNGGGVGALINSSTTTSSLTNSQSGLTVNNGIVLQGNATFGGSTTQGNINLYSAITDEGAGYSLTWAGPSGTELILNGSNTYLGGLNLNPNSIVVLSNSSGAGTGTINVPGGATLVLGISTTAATYFPNPITGSGTIDAGVASGNLYIGGALNNFTGTINIGQAVGVNTSATGAPQVVIGLENNMGFPINSAATWNIISGATLDMESPYTNDPAQVTINGVGANADGALRLDTCNQQGNVTLNGQNCWIGNGNNGSARGPSTISGVIQGSGNLILCFTGGSSMILTAQNIYSGSTVVSNGSWLALSGSGSINNSPAVLLMTNTVFDVSGVSGGYTLGTSAYQVLTNMGTGIITGNLTLGQYASLGLNGTTALTVTNGTLNLNNNNVTVAVSGSPGANGYLLIQGGAGGSVTGTVSSSQLTAYVNGVQNNNFYLTIIGGNLYMAPGPITILSGPNPQNPTVYSNSILTFNFNVSLVGAPPITNQWYVNGVAVSGATSTNFTLSLTNPTPGSTTVTFGATNSFSSGGVANSSTVTVLAPPTLSFDSSVTAYNPLGYWKLNEAGSGMYNNNNGVVCHDYINGNNGVYTNTSLGNTGYDAIDANLTPPDANYDDETSAYFGFINTPNSCAYGIPTNVDVSAPTNTSSTFTIMAWVQAPSLISDSINTPTIAAKGYYYNEQFTLDCGTHINSECAYRFTVRNAGGALYGVSSTLLAGADQNWHFLVGVCDEVHTNVAFYIDGTNVGTEAIPAGSGIVFSNVSVPMTIGARSSSATAGYDQQFTGYINDVALLTNALTASQVQNLYYAAGIPASATYASNNITINENDTLVFPSYTNGSPPLSIQWYVSDNITNNTIPIAGQTNATLVYSNVPGWAYLIWEVVSNAYGGQSNLAAGIVVNSGGPQVTGPTPTVIYVPAGAQVPLSVSVVGADSPFIYQWYAGYQTGNQMEIANATNATYTVTAQQGTNYYGCYVTNSVSTGQSASVEVIATLAPPVVNLENPSLWSFQHYASLPAWTPTMANGILEMTSDAGNESGSAFYEIPQYIAGGFVASYIYTPSLGSGTRADGTAFVLQNATNSSPSYTATGGGGGAIGLSSISPSVAFIMDLYTGSVGGTGINWSTNGAAASGAPTGAPNGGTAPININSLDPIKVTITYTPNNSNVQVTLTDVETTATFTTNYTTGNLAAMLGGVDAYVGFTGSTGGSYAQQDITEFSFAYTTANEAPAIITDITPTNMVAPEEAQVTYSVGAIGTAPLYYQWYLNGTNNGNAIATATNSSYTFNAASGTNTYQCIVSNAVGGSSNLAFSSVATVAASLAPAAINFSNTSLWQQQGAVFTPVFSSSDVLTNTTAIGDEAASSYYTIPQYVNNGFTASFTYQASGGTSTRADGTAFVLQNSANGPFALGYFGGGLGVAGTAPCLNVNLDIYSGASGGTGLGFGTNGSTAEETGAADISTSPVNINSGDPIQVTIGYHPETGLGYITLADAVANTSFSTTVQLGNNLSLLTGGDAVYVGFTGGTGADTSIQTIQNFSLSLTGPAAAIFQDLTPLNPQLYVGDSITYSVGASGVQPISYEWLSNGVVVPGATGPSFTLTVPSGATTVQCGVTNTYSGSVYVMSSTATVTGIAVPTDPYGTNVLGLGPVAYWRLTEGRGTNTAYDYVGGYNGTYGADTTNGQPGIPNPPFAGFPADELGVWMDNSAGVTTTAGCVATTAGNLPATNMTITCWVYPNGTQAVSEGIVFARTGGYGYGINMGGSEYFSYTWANNASTYDWTSDLLIPTNQWSFLALVITPSNAVAYVANTNSGLISNTNNVANTPTAIPASFTLGADTTSLPARTFNGELDEVAIFTNVLTTAQLAQMYSLASNTVSTVQAAFSGLASPSITYGTGSVALTGNVSGPGNVYPAITESVSATINGYTVNGSFIDNVGDFTINYNNSSLATDGIGSHPITYAYAGDSSLTGATNSSATLTITAATQPKITSVTLNGTNLVISATNGAPFGTYVLLESSNLINWTPVVTNTFNASGNVTLTNGVNTNLSPQYFNIENQ